MQNGGPLRIAQEPTFAQGAAYMYEHTYALAVRGRLRRRRTSPTTHAVYIGADDRQVLACDRLQPIGPHRRLTTGEPSCPHCRAVIGLDAGGPR
jgi:hypothetical protein